MAKYDWDKIRNEYIKSTISMQKLALKNKIPYKTLESKASKEKWNSQRKNIQEKVRQKTGEKTVEKISEKLSDRNAKHIEVWDLLMSKAKLLAEVACFESKDIDALAKAMDKIQKGHRLAEGLLSEMEKKRLELEEKKLKVVEDTGAKLIFTDMPIPGEDYGPDD